MVLRSRCLAVSVHGRTFAWVTAATVGALALSLLVVGWREGRSEGLSAQRAAQALASVQTDPARSASLVLEDLTSDPAPETAYAAREALEQLRHVRHVRRAQGMAITYAHVDPTTRLTFVVDNRGQVGVWSGPSGTTLSERAVPGAPITTLDYSAELDLLVTGNSLGCVWLWRLDEQHRLQLPMRLAADDSNRDRHSVILRASFYDADRRVVAVPASGPFLVWDLDTDHGVTWTRTTDLNINPDGGVRTAVSAAGTRAQKGSFIYLAAGSGIQKVSLPSSAPSADGSSVRVPPPVTIPSVDMDKVLDLASFPTDGGTRLAAVSRKRGLQTWWVPDLGQPVPGIPESPPVGAESVAFTADGTALTTAGQGGVRVRSVPEDDGTSQSQQQADQLLPVAASIVGSLAGEDCFAVTVSGDVYELSPTLDRTRTGRTQASTDIVFDQTDSLTTVHLTTSNHADSLQVNTPAKDLRASPDMIVTASFLPDANWWRGDQAFFVNDLAADDHFLIAGGETPIRTGAVMVWDSRTRDPVKLLQVHPRHEKDSNTPDLVTSVAVFPQRHLLVARTAAGELIGWSSRTWQEEFRVSLGWGGRMSRSLVRDRWLIATVTDSSNPRAAAGAPTYRLALVDLDHPQDVRAVNTVKGIIGLAMAPSGDLMAVSRLGREITLLDGQGNVLGEPIQLDGPAHTMAFSHDGRTLAVSLYDGRLLLVDVADRRTEALIASYPAGQAASNLAWSHDDSRLAVSVSEEGDGYSVADHVDVFAASPKRWSAELMAILGAS